MTNTCSHCKTVPSSIKRCSKCHIVPYCSRTCQKADWKAHKKICDRGATHATYFDDSTFIDDLPDPSTVPGHPFPDRQPSEFSTKLANDYLHKFKTHEEVYGQLIDAFRLRIEDEYTFNGDTYGVYAGEDSVELFGEFLEMAELCDGLLPGWWNWKKKEECVRLGIKGGEDGWYELNCAVEASDMVEHYEDPGMLMKLRVLAERISGNAVMRQFDESLLEL